MNWGWLIGLGGAYYAKKNLDAKSEQNRLDAERNKLAADDNEIKKLRYQLEQERHALEEERHVLESERPVIETKRTKKAKKSSKNKKKKSKNNELGNGDIDLGSRCSGCGFFLVNCTCSLESIKVSRSVADTDDKGMWESFSSEERFGCVGGLIILLLIILSAV